MYNTDVPCVICYFITLQKMVSRSFYLLWQFAQPILFGLIGAALNIRDISGALIGTVQRDNSFLKSIIACSSYYLPQ